MLAIDLGPELEHPLAKAAERSSQTPETFAREAIERMIEDAEDIASAREVLKDYDPSTNVSLEEVVRRLGLEDRVRAARR